MTSGNIAIAGRVVPRIGLGTMRIPFGANGGAPDVLRTALELGVRVIDTAWYYGEAVAAHRLIATSLRPYPVDLVIATKLGYRRTHTGALVPAVSARALREGNQRDRESLALESVPVTHLRWSGPDMTVEGVSFEEAFGVLLELRSEGLIEHVGLSNVTAKQLEVALSLGPVASVSNALNVANERHPVLAMCESAGIPFLAFSPFLLQGPRISDALRVVAGGSGSTPARVLLAWMLADSPMMLPIPGTSDAVHLRDNISAQELILSASSLEFLRFAARGSRTALTGGEAVPAQSTARQTVEGGHRAGEYEPGHR